MITTIKMSPDASCMVECRFPGTDKLYTYRCNTALVSILSEGDEIAVNTRYGVKYANFVARSSRSYSGPLSWVLSQSHLNKEMFQKINKKLTDGMEVVIQVEVRETGFSVGTISTERITADSIHPKEEGRIEILLSEIHIENSNFLRKVEDKIKQRKNAHRRLL